MKTIEQKLARQYPLLGSSADPESISLAVKGVGVAIIPILIIIFKMFDIDFTEVELIDLVNTIATALASVMIIIGGLRKFYFAVINSEFFKKLK